MPRTKTTTETVYTFKELSESAQQRAVEKESESQSEIFDQSTDFVYEDANRMAEILGIEIRPREVKTMGGTVRYEPTIYYSGFSSQGDGACFEGTYTYKKGAPKAIRAEAPEDKELHRIADELVALQKPFFYGLTATMKHSGHYYHSGCMEVDVEHSGERGDSYTSIPWEDLTRLMRDFADWIYKQLNNEFDYRTSYDTCREYLAEESDQEFTENGDRA